MGLVAKAWAQMDTVRAFSYLEGNLPALISRITDLAAHTSATHTEYYEVCRRQKSPRLLCPTNSSVRPMQPDRAVWIDQTRGPSNTDKSIAKAKDSSGSFQCAGRKRHRDENLSISRNEPFALMNKRHKVIIEYDGHTQKVLEKSSGILVSVGAISDERKCRRCRRAFFQRHGTKLLFSQSSTGRMGESNQPQVVTSNLVRRIETGPGMIGVFGSRKAQKKSVIDLADKELQLVHELCETAAYQALQTGDCVSEIDSAANNLKKLLKMANNEVRCLTEEELQQTTKETFANAPPNSSAARLARVAAVSTRELSTVGTCIIEVDEASYLSAESLNRLEFLS